jgi:hypothetical protein
VAFDRELNDSDAEALHDALERLDLAPAVGPTPHRKRSFRVTADADSLQAAIRDVLQVALEAADSGLTDPVTAEIGPDTDDEDQDETPDRLADELAGLAEAVEILGTSKARVTQLVDDGTLRPYLRAQLASGPVFDASALRHYAAQRTPGGRGPAALDLTPAARALLEVLAAVDAGSSPPAESAEHKAAAAAASPSGKADLVLLALGEHAVVRHALDELAGHALVRPRRLFVNERRADRPEDRVVRLLPKGRRQAGLTH